MSIYKMNNETIGCGTVGCGLGHSIDIEGLNPWPGKNQQGIYELTCHPDFDWRDYCYDTFGVPRGVREGDTVWQLIFGSAWAKIDPTRQGFIDRIDWLLTPGNQQKLKEFDASLTAAATAYEMWQDLI
ncbi:MAG: hypothetical protein KAJ03_04060 [Gammaproteobacteria bacterium]|nr:hypothetical protein [Gammaproteobacteria bacterium]